MTQETQLELQPLTDELRRNKERLELALAAARMGVWEWNARTNEVLLSPECYSILGMQASALTPEFINRLFHPHDAERVSVATKQALSDGQNLLSEFRIIRPDGNVRWVCMFGRAEFAQDEQPLRMVGTVQDITERKETSEKLQANEQQLRELADAMPQIVWTTSPDGGLVYFNRRGVEYVGGKTEKNLSWQWQQRIHPDDVSQTMQRWTSALQTACVHEVEHRILRHDGEYRWHVTRATPVRNAQGEIVRWIGTSTDIHEQKRAEEAHRENEARFLALVEHGYDGLTIVDAQEAVMYSSPANERILGHTALEMRGRPGLAFAHPDDQLDARTKLAAVVRSPGQIFHHTLRLRHKSGDWRWLECRFCNLIDNPAICGIVINWRDVSERLKTEQVLTQKRLILEKIAAGTKLKIVLDEIVSLVENKFPGSLCSVLLHDQNTQTLKLGSGPNLPPEYNAAIEGIKIGPAEGACGTAVYLGKTVVAADIATDPLWAHYRDLALTHNLRSCWSVPIQAANNDEAGIGATIVLGTFALYRHEPSEPSPQDLKAIAAAAHLAGIAIERDLSERTLRESEERYRQIAEALQTEHARFTQIVATAPGVICSFQLRPDGSMAMPYASPGLLELYGLRPDEVALDATPILSRIHSEDTERVRQAIAESARTMSVWHAEFRFQHPIKGEIWVEGRSTPSRQPDGTVLWFGIITDISQRRKAEAEWRRTAELLNVVAAGTTDAIFVKDQEGKYLLFNEAAARFVGRPVAEVLGRDDTELFDADGARHVMARDRRVMATGNTETEEEELTAVGKTRTYLVTKAPYRDERGNVVGIMGVSRDITERKASERQLIESEERYRRLVEVLPDAVFINSGDQIVFCNPAFVRLMGARDAHQLLGRSPLELMAPEHRADVRQRIETMLTEGKPVPPRENEFIRVDGGIVPVQVTATPITYHGRPSILVVMHDLSELKRSAELLRSVMQSVLDAIITLDEQGTIRSLNPAVERLFGYQAAELVGQNFKLLMPEPHGRGQKDYVANYLRTGVAKDFGIGREVEGRRKDGSVFPAELEVTEFVLDGVRHFTGVMRDISARKALEAQFRQAHKMEAIGLLAGGVAHDFNNLLCVINGFADLLLQKKSPNAPEHGPLQQIRNAGKRAADLTNQLLTFGRKAMIELQILNLNEIISRAENMLNCLVGEDIALSTELESDLCLVKFDSSQIEQVVLNLVVNARDALPQGGKITVATRNVELKPAQIKRQTDFKSGRYVELTVSDNGVGMTDEVKELIFDPFFTTKGQGKGTGLGLAVVHGIVKQNEGHIEVLTKLGAGTTFRILLPAATAPNSVKSDVASPLLRGHEKILLVEDEPAVLGIAKRSLQTYGYSVLTASSGQEAVSLLECDQQPFDLLVTDVVMPDMNGRQLAELVLSRFPSVPVLFISGYTADEVIRRGVLEFNVEFLHKPFTPLSLATKVREVLDSSARGEGKQL